MMVPCGAAGRSGGDRIAALLRERKIRLGASRDGYLARMGLSPFLPRGHRVGSVGNVIDLVVARSVRLGEIRSRRNHDVGFHLGMDVAQQRNYTGRVELEVALFAMRPGAQVVAQLLVS